MADSSSPRHWYWITAIGADHPGIVAALSKLIAARGGNLEDASMSRFRSWFAVMMLASFRDEPELTDALNALAGEHGLSIEARQVPASAADAQTAMKAPTHRVSVYGSDRSGIVADVADELLRRGANILDVEMDVSRGSGEATDNLFVMVMDVEATAEQVSGLEDELSRRLRMDIHVVPLQGIVL